MIDQAERSNLVSNGFFALLASSHLTPIPFHPIPSPMPTTTSTKVKWTPSTIAAYNSTRDERRRTHGRVAWSTLSASERASSTEKALERARVLDDEISNLKTQAWELGKYPAMAIYVAQKDGMLVVPGIYSDGKDPVMVRNMFSCTIAKLHARLYGDLTITSQ
jgi:hypothetical protein